MEKLKKYNQWLLAIIGSVGVILAIGLLIVAAFNVFDDLFNSYSPPASVMVSSENENSEGEPKMRSQILNYGTPQLLDSALSLYVIGVGQKNLAKPEEYDGQLVVIESYESKSWGRTINSSYYDLLNNLLVFKPKESFIGPIFKYKVSIETFAYNSIGDKKMLFIKGATDDTNSDNKLNNSDFQRLFIYDFNSEKLYPINLGQNTSYDSYQLVLDKEEMIIQYYLDRNNNKELDYNLDPILLKKISFENGIQVVDFIDDELNTQLQQILDN